MWTAIIAGLDLGEFLQLKHLQNQGYHVALIARNSTFFWTGQEERSKGLQDLRVCVCDLNNPRRSTGTMASIRLIVPPVHVMVYNAGAGFSQPVLGGRSKDSRNSARCRPWSTSPRKYCQAWHLQFRPVYTGAAASLRSNPKFLYCYSRWGLRACNGSISCKIWTAKHPRFPCHSWLGLVDSEKARSWVKNLTEHSMIKPGCWRGVFEIGQTA
jgi:hypothetical protein